METYNGVGKITRINMNESGKTWYYVEIDINGQIRTAQTDSYRETPDDIKKGDRVNVVYHYTKGGDVRCYITSEGFVRVIDETQKDPPVLLFFGLIILAVFVILAYKAISLYLS